MPKLAQVGNHQKRETVDARDHTSCRMIHCSAAETGIPIMGGRKERVHSRADIPIPNQRSERIERHNSRADILIPKSMGRSE